MATRTTAPHPPRAEQDAADAFANAGPNPTKVDISKYLDTRFNGSTT